MAELINGFAAHLARAHAALRRLWLARACGLFVLAVVAASVPGWVGVGAALGVALVGAAVDRYLRGDAFVVLLFLSVRADLLRDVVATGVDLTPRERRRLHGLLARADRVLS